ncbi:hypothetical protein G3545_06210 [Starkeya sp. ORNL1]|uniref:hypothetical protein n=1 Tax=Starkeya sp. ORNL1 TaxID=2709380 RepID=UPI001463875F|nr:hypothetical protein [Starkeya sp. ORNL1]QJP13279.1 hypothetical protein G3545_06210 [Starkeya sp. ORNL1]
MCDYSLESVASRPAEVGDKLVSSLFTNSGTRGFAAVGEPECAVCLLPGTELAFENQVEFEGRFGFFSTRKINQTVARFRHINENIPRVHHDALEFADGRIVLLTQLKDGQFAQVLQLPADPHVEKSTPDAESQSVLV